MRLLDDVIIHAHQLHKIGSCNDVYMAVSCGRAVGMGLRDCVVYNCRGGGMEGML